MKMPNFLIIGAGKAGTSSLYQYLKQHPQIYMSPNKETNFFALEGQELNFADSQARINKYSITKIEDYYAQFEAVSNETAIGEASPLYLYDPKAPERIRHYIPNVKLIAILRNPVDRAYASFLYLHREQRESLEHFSEALDAESNRIQSNWPWIWHYKNLGFYAEQLQRYFKRFDRAKIQIYLYEDFQKDNLAILQDIFRFFEVEDTFVPNTSLKYNTSGIPKNKLLQSILFGPNLVKSIFKPLLPRGLRKRLLFKGQKLNMTKPECPPAIRQKLIEVYREDILNLEQLINRDLSHWLKG